jgi:hypothetical protein
MHQLFQPMTLSKRVAIIPLFIGFSLFYNNANAQLWRYLNDSPGKQRAAYYSANKFKTKHFRGNYPAINWARLNIII